MLRKGFGVVEMKARAFHISMAVLLACMAVAVLGFSLDWPRTAFPVTSPSHVTSPSDVSSPSHVAGPSEGAKEEAMLPAPVAQGSAPTKAFLPMVARKYPPPPPIFGGEMWGIKDSRGLPYAVEGGIHWVRFGAFAWDAIEPVRTNPPSYKWEGVDEDSLRNASANGLEVIAILRFTPPWAQKYPGSSCGPIAEEALDEFAQFLTALVSRYSAPPFNVRYWELGNEPDVPVWYDPTVYGCWGDESDPYYGGGYYAEMLKRAYPAIKAADPGAQVLIGGLLLDCDPTNPPPGKDCKPARFLEGILRNGGGPYFDIVSFHGYPPYAGSLSLQLDERFPSWDKRGGVVLGKVDFLREVMATYGVDKQIIHTEGSLICPEMNEEVCNPPGPDFYEAQADYVAWLFVRNWAEGLLGTVWYTFEYPGWRYGSMLDENQQPKPAWYALDFLTEELHNGYYQAPVTQYPTLQGYEFSVSGKRVWVLWAPDEQPKTISLPGEVTRVYDKYGNDITPAGGTLTVSSPVYVELTP